MRRTAFTFGVRATIDAARAAGGPSSDPVLFTFADDFSTAGAWPGRAGWRTLANDARVWPLFSVGNGATHSDFGYGTPGNYAFVDSGRTDSQFVEGRVPASGTLMLAMRLADENNNLLFTVTPAANALIQIVLTAGGAASNLFLHFSSPLAIVAGDLIRLETAGDVLTLSINGARYPDAATSWSVAALARSGKAGVPADQNGSVEDFATGYLGTDARVRLTLDPIRRVVQRDRGATAKAVPIGGRCSGVNGAPQMRLLTAAGAVVPGWNWGARPLTGFTSDGESWSAATAAIPQGDGYRIEVRDAADANAGSRSNVFGVGIVFALYGQSNATGMSDGPYFTPTTPIAIAVNPSSAAALNPPQIPLQLFDTVSWPRSGIGRAADALSAAAGGLPVAFIPGGYGGQPIAALVPGSATIPDGWTINVWTALEQVIAASGGDIEGIVYVQGESDAGSGGGAGFVPAAYKAGLDAIHARLKAITGRDVTQLRFVIHGLGRVANAPAGYDGGTNWREVRKAQFEWCRDTAGALLGSTALDIAMNMDQGAWPIPAWHRAISDAGYGEDGKRIGAALARLYGYAATDRRGPVPTVMSRSGKTLAIAFDPNGATAMTCAAAIATNFEFATDATFATRLTPTAMAIDNAAHTATFTFASAPPAGAAVRGPTGINPDVANALRGTQADGAGVMSWPIFDALVAA